MDVKEFDQRFRKYAGNIKKEISKALAGDKDEFSDYVREQLFSGINGRGKELRPTYINDPYFKERFGKNWRKNAIGYMNWKWDKAYPSLPSYLGIPRRKKETPNLIITGEFYGSIYVEGQADGLSIGTRGTSFGDDIERKYGSVIFGISPAARKYYLQYKFNDKMVSIYNKYMRE